MRIAAKVRHEKDAHPERFCADRRCLWRVRHLGAPDTPCPKHPQSQRSEDAHEFGCTAYVGRPCICSTLRKERALLRNLRSDDPPKWLQEPLPLFATDASPAKGE